MKIDVILSPLELPALARRDLSGTACVVFDILRATSTFVTALQNGAQAIIPVSEIAEAVALRQSHPDFLLAGERDGVRIRAAQTGGIDFNFGNSPREFTPEKVRGKTIVSTTTNGTRALKACAGAKTVLAGSFLNLAATADFLRGEKAILLVCAGTGDVVADEDVLAAGALIENIQRPTSDIQHPMNARGAGGLSLDDSSRLALEKFLAAKMDLPAALSRSKNGKRLLSLAELRDDVAFCAQRNGFHLVAAMGGDGGLRRV